MPPERSKKLKERADLARRIESTGIEMSPCSFCERNGHKCVVAEKSSRCAECARRGRRCDVAGPSSGEWAAVEKEEARLASARDTAFAAAMENLARVQRLEKQQSLLKRRAAEMLRRGLQSLDELDAAEEAERQENVRQEREETERREREAQAATSAVPTDASFDPLTGYSGVALDSDLSALPASFWNDFGVGGTASQDGRS